MTAFKPLLLLAAALLLAGAAVAEKARLLEVRLGGRPLHDTGVWAR
jgi:hypothetical protein